MATSHWHLSNANANTAATHPSKFHSFSFTDVHTCKLGSNSNIVSPRLISVISQGPPALKHQHLSTYIQQIH